jgi:hypothetical protein
LQQRAKSLIDRDRLQRVESSNGLAAMTFILIGAVVEGPTGFGVAHQIGIGSLFDGYGGCRNVIKFISPRNQPLISCTQSSPISPNVCKKTLGLLSASNLSIQPLCQHINTCKHW